MKPKKSVLKMTMMTLLASLCCFSCNEGSSDGDSSNMSSTNQNTTAAGSDAPASGDGLQFKGFVPSAFDVTVDGVAYLDLEDFYTQELSRLPAKVKEAGYDADYTITFDAQIGFSDLWSDMTVYIVSENDRGYFGKGQVEEDGSFAINLPPTDSKGSYKVRANKRIGITLQRELETVNICYNFSAIDQSVSFDEQQKPIILKDFVSKITAYACPSLQSDGMAIPTAAPSQMPAVKLEIGMSKREVLTHYGSSGLLIESETRWCYGSEDFSRHRYCATQSYLSCQCGINFDSDGNLVSVENIDIDVLGDSLLY